MGVLRKFICKDNGHNIANCIDFIIDKSIVSDKTKMDLMTILLMWAVHYLAILIVMLSIILC